MCAGQDPLRDVRRPSVRRLREESRHIEHNEIETIARIIVRNALENIDASSEHEALVSAGLVGYDDESNLVEAIAAIQDHLVEGLRK